MLKFQGYHRSNEGIIGRVVSRYDQVGGRATRELDEAIFADLLRVRGRILMRESQVIDGICTGCSPERPPLPPPNQSNDVRKRREEICNEACGSKGNLSGNRPPRPKIDRGE